MATDPLYQHQQQFPAPSHFDPAVMDGKHFHHQQQQQHHHQPQHQQPHHPHSHYHQESPVTHTQDQIGWYFVEQYYTTLSREPERLHLYYNKPSQFCFGNEAEKVTVAVGLSVCRHLRPITVFFFLDFYVLVLTFLLGNSISHPIARLPLMQGPRSQR